VCAMAKLDSKGLRKIRHRRVRGRVIGTALRPRLCVFRSLNHIYAQIIDDSISQTLVSMSTLGADLRDKTRQLTKTEGAEIVGSLLGQKALHEGVKRVVFDRGGYQYHGRVKALADAARQAGLEF
jgi:large subunit ribosomal protein L18